MRWALLICLSLKQISNKYSTTKFAVVLFILTLTGKSLPLSSFSWLLLGNKLLAQNWGWKCQDTHLLGFSSAAHTEHGICYYTFSPLSVPLEREGIPTEESIESLWSNAGKEIPFLKANLPAGALHSPGFSTDPLGKVAKNSLTRNKRKGKTPLSVLTPCSTTVLKNELEGIPYMGWHHLLACWRKQTELLCQCSYSKPYFCNDNAEYRFRGVHFCPQ